MDFDLKIVGGDIIDGTGAPRYRGDVGIKNGRITALGQVDGTAARTIDAGGMAVCPGFVDVHTHYDAQVLWDPVMTVSPWHGVTSAVLGNCGFGIAPTRPEHRDLILRTLERVEGMTLSALQTGIGAQWPFVSFPEYMDALDRRGVAINVAVLAGHTPIRLFVMGAEAVDRAARPDEIAAMKTLVRGAIDAGAIGFGTSVSPIHLGFDNKPVPSRLATFDEIMALCAALGEAGKGIIHYNVGRVPHFEEYEQLVRSTGRPLCWTALLAGGMRPGEHLQYLERSHELLAAGLPIHPQGAARPITLEFDFRMPTVFDTWNNFAPVRVAKNDAERLAVYADSAFRQRFKDEVAGRGSNPQHFAAGQREHDMNVGYWRQTAVSFCPTDPSLEERLVYDIAAERGIDPIDLAFDLVGQSQLQARFRMPRANSNDAEVADIMSDPAVVLGLGDGGAHVSQLCDACWTTYTLGYWVRERGVLSLEQAVHRMTAQPAAVYGITDRGTLALGQAGDVVVFDPATVMSGPLERVADLPGGAERLVSRPRGIAAVVVNGVPLPAAGMQPPEVMPGKVLRSGRASS
jgi:N-acyl-D-aspartate/D-glutamate deacylase